MKLLLKNGTIINYANKFQEVVDLLIENEKIKKIEKNIAETADRIIDCTGLYIMPGMIDMHCHLREPGGEHKETIETGSNSAIKVVLQQFALCQIQNQHQIALLFYLK